MREKRPPRSLRPLPPFRSAEEPVGDARDTDFLALGLGGTNMMAMLWSVALGKRVVGVEMRGDPFLGVHWNIREDLYHQLGRIDRMMLERYGEAGVPRRADGRIFKLADVFYSTETVAGDVVPDEVIDGYDKHQHLAGTIHHVEFIDDRWRDGLPHRVVTILSPPKPPTTPVDEKIRDEMVDVLAGPSTFQASASSILLLLRRYLERIEALDAETGRDPPRVRIFNRHRVIPGEGRGFRRLADGRLAVTIEQLQELDFKGSLTRVRAPGTEPLDLGCPELVMIAQGFHSGDADALGFEQEDVALDHGDGRGPVVAQADFLAGLIEVLVGGRLRRRISTEIDAAGNEYWVRQIAVGHEDDPEVGWVLVQVPDFQTFDPVHEGLVDADTDPDSPEYYAAYQHLVYEYFIQQCSDVLELPVSQLRKVQMVYGPKLFSLIERVGADARIAKNAVVAGDSFGNGHFLTSGGAMTGMVGHGARVLRYWQARAAGADADAAVAELALAIKADTHAWLQVSASEYTDAAPINFGAERIRQIEAAGGFQKNVRSNSIDAARRRRHALVPLDASDWRRLFLRNGRVHSAQLPDLHAMHPVFRAQQQQQERRRRRRGKGISVAYVVTSFDKRTLRFLRGVLGQPSVRLGLISRDPPELLPEAVRVRLVSHAVVADPTDPSDIALAVKEMRPELGEAALLLGTHEDLQLPLAEAREALGMRGLTRDALDRYRDKERMRALLADAGFPVTRACVVGGAAGAAAAAAAAAAATVGYPLLLKSCERTSSGATRLIADEPTLVRALAAAPPQQRFLCEELVDGGTGTLDVMCVNGAPAMVSATRVTPGFPRGPGDGGDDVAARTVLLPREADDPLDAVARQVCLSALRVLGLVPGLTHIQWVRRRDGSFALSDVTPRPPGMQIVPLMSHAYDADIFRAWANAMVNGLFVPIPRLRAAGAVLLRGQGGGRGARVSAVRGLDDVTRELGPIVVDASLPAPGDVDATGAVVVRHEETAVVAAALARIAASVRIELA